ncbi:MAG TPA: hypothetical protein VE685_21530 [Thermoanaerobaculia bacterium]|nr:hypothetical protein [Thermoanaerobaculia bacterium]
MSNEETLNEDGRLEEIAARLRELPGEAEPARDLWPEVAARIAPREVPERKAVPASRLSRRERVLLQMAAALAIFAGGVMVGRGTVERPAEIPWASRDPLRTAAEVQRTGSQYIAALSSLTSAQGPSLDQGREAALSTLYGAAYELNKLPSEDLSQVLHAVSATQRRAGNPVQPAASRPVPF